MILFEPISPRHRVREEQLGQFCSGHRSHGTTSQPGRHPRRQNAAAATTDPPALCDRSHVCLPSLAVFTLGGLIAGVVAAFIVGISKTGLPGSALAAIPLIAVVVEGRMIPGATLPLLIVADLFAVAWYRRHTRWDVLRGLAPWLGVGFLAGIGFFIVVGAATKQLERAIGVILVVIVLLQLWRMYRDVAPRTGVGTAAGFGTAGGFTTFVANAAGPVLNTHLAGLRLDKSELLGSAAWLYFVLNVAKIPFYLALGSWFEGGPFFTVESLAWNLVLVPAIVAGVFTGRYVYRRIPQRRFLLAVLLLSVAGALALVF